MRSGWNSLEDFPQYGRQSTELAELCSILFELLPAGYLAMEQEPADFLEAGLPGKLCHIVAAVSQFGALGANRRNRG